MSAVLQGDFDADQLLEAAIRGESSRTSAAVSARLAGAMFRKRWCRHSSASRQGVKEHLHDPAFQEEYRRELREWVGRPTALTYAPQPVQGLGCRRLAQARGSRAHGRPQDQQRDRSGATREAPRRETGYRGNRCRPARCRLGRGLRAGWPAVHGLHGRRRHGAPSAERRPHASPRRGVRRRRIGRQDSARSD